MKSEFLTISVVIAAFLQGLAALFDKYKFSGKSQDRFRYVLVKSFIVIDNAALPDIANFSIKLLTASHHKVTSVRALIQMTLSSCISVVMSVSVFVYLFYYFGYDSYLEIFYWAIPASQVAIVYLTRADLLLSHANSMFAINVFSYVETFSPFFVCLVFIFLNVLILRYLYR